MDDLEQKLGTLHQQNAELMRERDEMAAALAAEALVIQDVLGHLTTTKESPQWTWVDFNYMVEGIRTNLSKTDRKRILAAHDAAIVEPLVRALELVRNPAISMVDVRQIIDKALAVHRKGGV